jgi:hypothetical protein
LRTQKNLPFPRVFISLSDFRRKRQRFTRSCFLSQGLTALGTANRGSSAAYGPPGKPESRDLISRSSLPLEAGWAGMRGRCAGLARRSQGQHHRTDWECRIRVACSKSLRTLEDGRSSAYGGAGRAARERGRPDTHFRGAGGVAEARLQGLAAAQLGVAGGGARDHGRPDTHFRGAGSVAEACLQGLAAAQLGGAGWASNQCPARRTGLDASRRPAPRGTSNTEKSGSGRHLLIRSTGVRLTAAGIQVFDVQVELAAWVRRAGARGRCPSSTRHGSQRGIA